MAAQDDLTHSLARSTQSINESSYYIVIVSFDRNTLSGAGWERNVASFPFYR